MNIHFSAAESTMLLPAVKRRALSYQNDLGWDSTTKKRLNKRMKDIERVVDGTVSYISPQNRAMLTGIVRELRSEYQSKIAYYQDMRDAELVLALANNFQEINQVNDVLSLLNRVKKKGSSCPLIGAYVGQLSFLISQSKGRLFYAASDTNIYKFGVPVSRTRYIEIPMSCNFNLTSLELWTLKGGLPQTSCKTVSNVCGILRILDEHELCSGLSGRQQMLKNILVQVGS